MNEARSSVSGMGIRKEQLNPHNRLVSHMEARLAQHLVWLLPVPRFSHGRKTAGAL